MLGWGAKRRAQAESSRATNIGPKLASFSDELCKISSAGTTLGAMATGAIGLGALGGIRAAVRDEDEDRLRKVLSGVKKGALVGALVALGLQRNAVGKNTLFGLKQ